MIPGKDIEIILCSQSPRRRSLVEGMGFPVQITSVDVDESFGAGIPMPEVARELSIRKADAYTEPLNEGQILLTADTLVSIDGKILGKPKDTKEAFAMLKSLSGKAHEVSTGFCLRSLKQEVVCVETTRVFFHEIPDETLEWYIETFQPFDKAGSYGIQEWIGYTGIQRVEGDFFNVIGLPLQRVYKELKAFRG